MFALKVTIPPALKKQAYRYPDVAAYSLTDTMRRTRAEARRLLDTEYPNLKKAHINLGSLFRIVGADKWELVGKLIVTSKKIPLINFVTNKTQTRKQIGIPVKSRVPLTYVGLKGQTHTAPHAFIFGKGKDARVSDPSQSWATGSTTGGTKEDRFQSMSLVSVSQLLRTRHMQDALEAFMAKTFTEIFRKKLDSLR